MTAYKHFYVKYDPRTDGWLIKDSWEILANKRDKKTAKLAARRLAKDEKPSRLHIEAKDGHEVSVTEYEQA